MVHTRCKWCDAIIPLAAGFTTAEWTKVAHVSGSNPWGFLQNPYPCDGSPLPRYTREQQEQNLLEMEL